MTSTGLSWFLAALLAYGIGSLPTAYLAVRWRTGQDLRRWGDGNVGAENATRILGQKWGIAIAGIDIAKGAAVVLLARVWLDSLPAEMIAGVAAVAGHSWPVWLRGHGGRGAALAGGVLLAMLPYPALPLALPTLLIFYATRSATKGIAFLFIGTPLIALLTPWFIPDSLRGAWPWDYSYPHIAYALGLPLLVGLIHFLSRRRTPAAQANSGGGSGPAGG